MVENSGTPRPMWPADHSNMGNDPCPEQNNFQVSLPLCQGHHSWP